MTLSPPLGWVWTVIVPHGEEGKADIDYRAPTVLARAGHSRFLIAFDYSTILMT